MVSPIDFDAYLAVAAARGYNVEELSIGELAVRLSRAAPVIEERKRKDEPAEQRSALDMLNDPPRPTEADVVTMPKGFEEAAPPGPSTPVQWADDEPPQTKE